MFATYKNPDASLFIRMDFSDDAAWHALCKLVQQPSPSDGFQACFAFVDDRNLVETSIETLAREAAADLRCAAIFVADAEAMSGEDHAVLCVNCSDNPAPSFRVIPAEVWGPENNLRLSNMAFAEFGRNTGPDGVFRGFPA
jgi:hypothetical protein